MIGAITFGEAMLIKNREYAGQLKDFSGLQEGKLYPTDIDGFIDFSDRLFIFIECKFINSHLKTGQRLALERLCNATHNPPKRHSIVLITHHESKGDIDLSNSVVTNYFWEREWRTCEPENLKTVIDNLRRKYV